MSVSQLLYGNSSVSLNMRFGRCILSPTRVQTVQGPVASQPLLVHVYTPVLVILVTSSIGSYYSPP